MKTNYLAAVKTSLLWLIIVVAGLIYLADNLSIVSNLEQFLPKNTRDNTTQILFNHLQKQQQKHLIFAKIQGADINKIVDINKKLKQILLKKPELFDFIANGQQDKNIQDYQNLMQYRYYLTKPDDFSKLSLRQNLTELLDIFSNNDNSKIIDYLLKDPQQSLKKYLKQLTPNADFAKYQGVWIVKNTNKQAGTILIIQPKNTSANGLKTIKQSFNTLSNNNANLVLSGADVIAATVQDNIERTISWLSWILVLVVVAVFWYFYRSKRLMIIAVLPLLISIVISMAVVQAIFGNIHGIVLAFGITSLGVSLDYPLHLFSHLHNKETPADTLKRLWGILRLGGLTSIFSYLAFIGTGFTGLTQLAVFCAVGLAVSLLVVRFLLPKLVSHLWVKKRSIIIVKPLSNKHKSIVSLVIIMLPILILWLTPDIIRTDINDINPATKPQLKLAQELRQKSNYGDDFLLVEGDNAQQVLIKTEAIKPKLQLAIKQNIIANFKLSSDILPSKKLQKLYQSLLPDEQELKQNIQIVSQDLGFKNQVFDDFVQAVILSKKHNLLDEVEMSKIFPKSGLESMLFTQNKRWYSLVSVDILDQQKFAIWLKNTEFEYLSAQKISNNLMANYFSVAYQRILLILLLISLLVLWQMRSNIDRIWLLVPIFSGVVMTLLVQVLLGHNITIFHLLALLLVIGMGFDYGLFFNQSCSNKRDLTNTNYAIFISAITTISVFGALGFSEVVILSGMGQIIAVGVLTCFISAAFISTPQRSGQ